MKSISEGKGDRSASSKYPLSLEWLSGAGLGEVITSLKLEKATDGGDLVALIEDARVEMEKVGECKPAAFLEVVETSAPEDVFGLGGSVGLGGSERSSEIDEFVERNVDRCRERLGPALCCGFCGGGLVFWDSAACGVSE